MWAHCERSLLMPAKGVRAKVHSWLVWYASSWSMAADLFGSFHGWGGGQYLGYLFWQEARCYFHLPWSIWGDKCLPHPDKWLLWFIARETELWLLYFISEKTSATRSMHCRPPFDQDSKVFFCLKDKVCTVAPEGDWRVVDKLKDFVSQASKSSVVSSKYKKGSRERNLTLLCPGWV